MRGLDSSLSVILLGLFLIVRIPIPNNSGRPSLLPVLLTTVELHRHVEDPGNWPQRVDSNVNDPGTSAIWDVRLEAVAPAGSNPGGSPIALGSVVTDDGDLWPTRDDPETHQLNDHGRWPGEQRAVEECPSMIHKVTQNPASPR
jgi:hypothetical protein